MSEQVYSAKYHSADGTLVYDVGYYLADEQRTELWVVRLTDEQAERVRTTLESMAEDEVFGWYECKVRTVELDPLDELGARLNQLMPRGRRVRA